MDISSVCFRNTPTPQERRELAEMPDKLQFGTELSIFPLNWLQ